MDGYVVEKYFFILVLINILLLAYASYILNQYVYNWYILGIVIAIFINLLLYLIILNYQHLHLL